MAETMVSNVKQLQIEPITKELTLGDLVKKYPSALNVFLSYGMPCVGCSVPTWMSISEAGKELGLNEASVNKMIIEANEAVINAMKNFKEGEALHVTDNAIKKVKELLKKEKKQDYALRIDVIEGGCSGMKYAFSLEKEPNKSDEVIEKKGLKIVINKEAENHLRGSSIDYIESLQGSGFKIDNPNAQHTCACGDSFH